MWGLGFKSGKGTSGTAELCVTEMELVEMFKERGGFSQKEVERSLEARIGSIGGDRLKAVQIIYEHEFGRN